MQAQYLSVTEVPGVRVHQEQLSALVTRYHLACQHAGGKDVLEVACGAGLGLGYLAGVATSVTAGDIEPANLRFAEDYYAERPKINLKVFDALEMPFARGSFDVVLNYEAIYYLSDLPRFLRETRRVLRPEGKLIISTVNPEWHGFNPSPFSTKYYSAAELQRELTYAGFDSKAYVAFHDDPSGSMRWLKAAVRRVAIALRLIPKTMKGKEFLKRLLYGKLTPLPPEIAEVSAPVEALIELTAPVCLSHYKTVYLVAELR